jgi:hypothetical protein
VAGTQQITKIKETKRIQIRRSRMREIFGNIWEIKCDAICITTNGVIRNDGKAVMGAGIAKQAKDKFPGIDDLLGAFLKLGGNNVHLILEAPNTPALVSFPTKNDWIDNSPLELIIRSSRQLVELTDQKGWGKVVLPRPGCGNGNLDWNVVKCQIETILNDRFFVITRSGIQRTFPAGRTFQRR